MRQQIEGGFTGILAAGKGRLVDTFGQQELLSMAIMWNSYPIPILVLWGRSDSINWAGRALPGGGTLYLFAVSIFAQLMWSG